MKNIMKNNVTRCVLVYGVVVISFVVIVAYNIENTIESMRKSIKKVTNSNV